MKKIGLRVVLMALTAVLLLGYSNVAVWAADDDEAAIKAQVKEFCEKWNNRDKSLMDVWRDDAKIMYGEDKTVTDKAGYLNVLDKRLRLLSAHPENECKVTMLEPNKARARIDVYNTANPISIILIKENGKWMWAEWWY
jgi:hypothetical protein